MTCSAHNVVEIMRSRRIIPTWRDVDENGTDCGLRRWHGPLRFATEFEGAGASVGCATQGSTQDWQSGQYSTFGCGSGLKEAFANEVSNQYNLYSIQQKFTT